MSRFLKRVLIFIVVIPMLVSSGIVLGEPWWMRFILGMITGYLVLELT